MAIDKSYEDFFNDDKRKEYAEKINTLAKFKGQRTSLDHFRKIKRAQLMKDFSSVHKAIAVQEREAEAHPDYAAIVEALEIAITEETKAYWALEMIKLEIDVWRTEQANIRRLDH